MESFDVFVVGGSAAGITAAVTCHRHYPDKSILLIRVADLLPTRQRGGNSHCCLLEAAGQLEGP